MTYIRDEKKNNRLISHRWISFEDVVEALEKWDLLETIDNPKAHIYESEKMFVITLHNYPHVVPFVYHKKTEEIELKTIYPDRTLKEKYWFTS